MHARITKALEKKDGGFTLIELLVVMIIIGILAAIAIPVFLNQRTKAYDSSAKADVSTIGKEVATYYVDGDATTVPTVTVTDGEYLVNGEAVGKVSSGVDLVLDDGISGTNSSDWCVSTSHSSGSTDWQYSAAGGLSEGNCA